MCVGWLLTDSSGSFGLECCSDFSSSGKEASFAPGMDAEGAERRSLVFAYYVTGHGFGHATRVVEVILV